jgi:hypothetical protein
MESINSNNIWSHIKNGERSSPGVVATVVQFSKSNKE